MSEPAFPVGYTFSASAPATFRIEPAATPETTREAPPAIVDKVVEPRRESVLAVATHRFLNGMGKLGAGLTTAAAFAGIGYALGDQQPPIHSDLGNFLGLLAAYGSAAIGGLVTVCWQLSDNYKSHTTNPTLRSLGNALGLVALPAAVGAGVGALAGPVWETSLAVVAGSIGFYFANSLRAARAGK
jgi:hypothetical protein